MVLISCTRKSSSTESEYNLSEGLVTVSSDSTELFASTLFHPFTRAGADQFSICVHNYLFIFRLLRCKRVENPAWGTVEFIDESAPDNDANQIVFRTIPEVRTRLSTSPRARSPTFPFRFAKSYTLTLGNCSQERDRLVVQLGTGEAGRALQSALIVANDVRAIDVNMGCPLKFSTSSGAGSALLKKPETVRDIMTTLRRNLPTDVHVTCKIRLLDTIEETVELARVIEACGVSAFGVHGRYVGQRPRQPAHWDMIKQVVDAVSCPVIANGDVFEYGDFERIREQTGAASAMCGRGAMWNQSIFRKDGLLTPRENLNKLMTKCLEWSHSMKNTKYLARCA